MRLDFGVFVMDPYNANEPCLDCGGKPRAGCRYCNACTVKILEAIFGPAAADGEDDE